MLPFESPNSEAYVLLQRIEVALRELTREHLLEHLGPAWHKHLPGDLLKKIRQAQRDEEARRQYEFLRLGPLYYLTFGELLDVLSQEQCRTLRTRLGGDTFFAVLRALLSPRNALSHSRGVSAAGLATVKAAYVQVETSLSRERLVELLSSPDTGIRPPDAKRVLARWLDSAKRCLASLDVCDAQPPELASSRQQFWWNSRELAGFDTQSVDRAANALSTYSSLSGLGSLADRQAFASATALSELLAQAIAALESTDE